MMQNKGSSLSETFNAYRYFRICDDYTTGGFSKSLPYLCALAGTTPEEAGWSDREECLNVLYDKLPQKYRSEIALIEKTLSDRYKIDADCEDDNLMQETISGLNKILRNIPNNSPQNTKIRLEILEHLYNVYEQLLPGNQTSRFAILKKMVKEIKHNDGSFDHDPLNITARRIDYFMKKIPAKERYTLLLEIDKKTIDRRQYDYTYMKKRFSEEYEEEKQQLKYLQREKNQERYEQIRHDELPAAQDNKTKINLYKELLTLINSQDWGRTRKFNEKKTIYNHLILLYQAENMPREAEQAKYEREKFINARNISREASRIKGYSFKNNHNSGR